MSFLDISTEVRLKIYSELLVSSAPVVFAAQCNPWLSPSLQRQRTWFYPAILRVSKQISREARPILYSNNCFEFSEDFSEDFSVSTEAKTRPFLDRIGINAKLIRHISIPFPTYHPDPPTKALDDETHIKNLEMICAMCTDVRTLEMQAPVEEYDYAFDNDLIEAETIGEGTLDLLNIRLKKIISLEKITVNFEVYPTGLDDDAKNAMQRLEWNIKLTELPKKTWLSDDDRVEFDNEDDLKAYNKKYWKEEEKRRVAKEKESWLEEYYSRRRDPYWKNDSDYD
ncbi:MAG: hypothetical protein M1814_006463 [Vezdaea aestivalis]|nr:MAG: hypothetical protein M1814_006463 [Vezdaea aestivalis]